MHPVDEDAWKNKVSFWRQTTAGTWILLFLWLCLYCVHSVNLPVFGYVPWENAPRMEFESEVACWRHLALAKKTNTFLLDKDCIGKDK